MRSNVPIKIDIPPGSENNTDQVGLLSKARKKYGEIPTFFGSYKTPIGIEVEVEGIQKAFPSSIFWNASDDGSLKIGGVEYISIPLAGHNIDYALLEIQNFLKTEDCLWSHRTSIHVHHYVGNLSLKQLQLLICLYAIYEPAFFSLVSEHRLGNPFCYPIRDISPESVVIGGDNRGKYCALNTTNSISAFNTVEFRHMNGTSDFRSIRRWLQLIVKLCRFVKIEKGLEKQIKELNTISNYDGLTKQIFGPSSKVFQALDLKACMEDGVLWSKVYLLGK